MCPSTMLLVIVLFFCYFYWIYMYWILPKWHVQGRSLTAIDKSVKKKT